LAEIGIVRRVRFRVLGPVEIETDGGQVVKLNRRQERCLLAILLLEAGRVVPVSRLCDLLWDGNPPDRARRAVRSHAAHIRAALSRAGAGERVVLVSQGEGYRLQTDPDAVDAHRFRTLLREARAAADARNRDRLLRIALDLWRGPALHDIGNEPLRQRLGAELDELHLSAVEESIDAGLALGRHAELVAQLRRLTAEHPTRYRLVGSYLLALYRAGRTADAVAVYADTRAQLADEFGIDPPPELSELHERILRDDPALRLPDRPAAPVVPAQLPADAAHFTGRADHLRTLDKLLDAGTGAAVVVTALAGTAGVGKTALAVHWAHRVRDRFPDGQLYVNLRGFDPSGTAAQPAEALGGFLDALRVPAHRIPAGLDAQSALYRTLLADKRMLVVLDNARDAEQVRPLLPGTARSLALITSRVQLTSLVATQGAESLVVDLLTGPEARDLLSRRIGAERTAAEPEAVDDIVASCARLPLAVSIVAARALIDPALSLTGLARELRAARTGLDVLTAGDAATDLRAVFSWSYRLLSAGARRLFRCLGRHPGPDFAASAAASLAGVPTAQATAYLTELCAAHLVTLTDGGRYLMHDLLRAYAAELSDAQDPQEDRRSAECRLLDHYVHTAYRAGGLLGPHRDPIALVPPGPGVTVDDLTDADEAAAWFSRERPALLATVRRSTRTGLDRYTWQLAWTLTAFLNMRGHLPDLVATQGAALDATERLADRRGQAFCHRILARGYAGMRRYDEAQVHYRQALDLFEELGDLAGKAHVHASFGWMLELQGRREDALAQDKRALELYTAAGHRLGRARALNMVGYSYAKLGDHVQAIAYCEQSLALNEELGDRYGAAATWDSLGYAHHHLGAHERAIACYEEALTRFREAGDRTNEAEILTHLGDAHEARGDAAGAGEVWRRALAILDDLESPDADEVRAKLDRAGGSAGPVGSAVGTVE